MRGKPTDAQIESEAIEFSGTVYSLVLRLSVLGISLRTRRNATRKFTRTIRARTRNNATTRDILRGGIRTIRTKRIMTNSLTLSRITGMNFRFFKNRLTLGSLVMFQFTYVRASVTNVTLITKTTIDGVIRVSLYRLASPPRYSFQPMQRHKTQ